MTMNVCEAGAVKDQKQDIGCKNFACGGNATCALGMMSPLTCAQHDAGDGAVAAVQNVHYETVVLQKWLRIYID